MSDPFKILVLCTGNICRSPAGELLLQHHLGDSVVVTSAGTHAMAGYPMEPAMAARMPADVDPSAFVARQLTPAMLREADLVIGMSREHRSRAVETFPAAVRRAFTLRELARVLSLHGAFAPGETPGQFLRVAVGQAGALRARARAASPELDDVVDPYKRDDTLFDEAFADIDEAVRAVAAAAHR
ncbi:arsenate reductase/protein-tyrosine-phosphatase family protein [Mariniluteicoccus flavus]